MEPVWFNSYPEGVPKYVDMDEFTSVSDVFLKACDEHKHKPAYTSLGHTISFGELEALTQQFSCYLQHELGLQKGDRIAIMLPNLVQYPVAVLSAMRLGLVIVNIDPLYTQRELKIQLNDSGAETILVLENFAIEVEKSLKDVPIKNVIVTKLGDCLPLLKGWGTNVAVKYIKKAVPKYDIADKHSFKAALSKFKGNTGALVDARLSQEDLLFLQYTGGTTGEPKGVEITHGNMIANIQMSKAWINSSLKKGIQHRVIAPLPMYHIFCMSMNLMVMMSLGIENILVLNPRDFNGFIRILQKNHFTGITAVNTLLRKLLDTPGFDKIDFSELDFTFAGGMAVTKDVATDWKTKTGSTVIEAYGLSECAPGVSSVPFDSTEFTGSIGLPLPNTNIKLLDDNDDEVGLNESGELCVAGPQVMRGYWKRPEATAEVMTEDGYLRTGDYVSIDDLGFIRVLDRKKDMILVSGFNVFPNEIEDVVNQLDGITESAAIGIEDRNAGQVVKLFLVASNDTISEKDVLTHCKENLTGYKRPKVIEFVTELPKSSVGKILRKKLR